MTKLIEMKQVTKTYGEGHLQVTALHETNFHLNAGEFVAIIGPSRSGKTTFLTTLGQLQHPSSGDILVKGKDTHQLSEKEKTALRFKEFGFILQTSNLIPFLTVKEQLDLIDRLDKGRSVKEDRQKLFDLLDLEKVKTATPKNFLGANVNVLRSQEPSTIIQVSFWPTNQLRVSTPNGLIKSLIC